MPSICRTRFAAASTAYILLASAAVSPAISATTLLYEPFDYTTGALDGASGGSGFQAASNWSVSIPGTATATVDIEANSLAFSDYPTTGNKFTVTVDAVTANSNIIAQRPVGFSVTGGDLWVSLLYQRVDASTNGSRTAEVRIDGASPQFGVKPKDSGTRNGTIRYDGSDGSQAGVLQDGDVRLIIAQFEDVGSEGATARMWDFDTAGYDAVKANGLTIAELGNPNIVDTLAAGDSRTVTSGDLMKLFAGTSQAPFSFSLDEIRYGTSLGSAINIVPEPATLGLVGAGLVAVTGRRRR